MVYSSKYQQHSWYPQGKGKQMYKYTPEQAVDKLVEIVGNPGFTKDHAKDIVYTMIGIEYNYEIEFLDDGHMTWLRNDAYEDGWIN